eukprot:4930988-Prymnesium_polylepis.1
MYATVALMHGTVALMHGTWQVLDEFEYAMPDDDFKAFWQSLAWPMKVEAAPPATPGPPLPSLGHPWGTP